MELLLAKPWLEGNQELGVSQVLQRQTELSPELHNGSHSFPSWAARGVCSWFHSTCVIFPLGLPGFQLEAQSQGRVGQPILPISEPPKGSEEALCVWGVLVGAGTKCPQHPLPRLGLPVEPQEYPVLLVGDAGAHPMHQASERGWMES